MSDILIIQNIPETERELLERIPLRQEYIDRLESMTNARRRVEWLASKVIIWDQFGQYIDYNKTNAPMISGGNISISHTQEHIAVIYSSDKLCAVDIESVDRNCASLAHKFTNHEELQLSEKIIPENPELLVWCAKEALYKLAGVAGAEFKTDLRIISVKGDIINASVFSKNVDLKFIIDRGLLIVYTPINCQIIDRR